MQSNDIASAVQMRENVTQSVLTTQSKLSARQFDGRKPWQFVGFSCKASLA